MVTVRDIESMAAVSPLTGKVTAKPDGSSSGIGPVPLPVVITCAWTNELIPKQIMMPINFFITRPFKTKIETIIVPHQHFESKLFKAHGLDIKLGGTAYFQTS